VAGMVITPANYEIAKKLLQSRYGQKEKLVHNLFNKLLNLENCDRSNIRCFFDKIFINVRSLENHNIKIDDHSVLLTSQILSKLPDFLRFKCVQKFSGGPWLMSTVLSVLEEHLQCEEACDFSQHEKRDFDTFDPNSTFSSLPASNFHTGTT